ncbi:prolipoprotein diacylglyceryl transferase [Hymenobacter convexus]|uniref:prolipoprotein diacylglyceryl transferase n=1 Tax=Hymenobacter sp. CA1UV-4 TaxID=3063782 RepID=UPI0027141108|nr:prolipoprotein diacylglyceryl transferase [Hymenobacter sp. CA1UV-4]MDO7853208.1 prolipoprotein diacylglyceryl transferase [Hymenobacter sp. CA1UV-4]
MSPFLAAIYWNINPIIAHIGWVTLRWYGLFFMLPFVVGTFILTHIYRSERVSPQWVDVITIYMLIGTIVGARLGHMLFYDFEALMADPMVVFKIWQGGLASHGATIGILLACWLFARNNKFDYLWVLDRIVIVVALGGACIRTGNLMNSEIVGKPTNVPWAFVFPRDVEHWKHFEPNQPVPAGSYAVQRIASPEKDREPSIVSQPVNGSVTRDTNVAVPRHPTQIYEALFCIFLLALLYSMWNRTKERTPRGQLFGLFVVLLFTQRFLGEYLKENQVAFEDGHLFNQGQLLSIPLIFIGIWVLWRAGKDPKNPYGYAPRDLEEKDAAALPSKAQ